MKKFAEIYAPLVKGEGLINYNLKRATFHPIDDIILIIWRKFHPASGKRAVNCSLNVGLMRNFCRGGVSPPERVLIQFLDK